MINNETIVGLPVTAGANGPLIFAKCLGNPNTFALDANTYAVGCVLLQQDATTGYTNVPWQNTGTLAVPVWTVVGNGKVVSGSGATVALTQAQNGSLCIMDRAAGIVFTLPAPVVGTYFDFMVLTSVTTNAYKVITDALTTFMLGSLVNIDTDSSNAVAAWTADGSTIRSVSMNGTTTGGLKGTSFRATCISTTEWMIQGIDQGNGVVATPFATS